MSLTPQPHDVSNRYLSPWAVVIVIIVMWLWPAAKNAFGSYADAVPVATLIAGAGTAVKYSNRRDFRQRFSAA
jgi:Na+/H+ antiporter NhaC